MLLATKPRWPLMDVDAAGSARAKVESELARVQNALAVSEEARRKAEDGRRG